MELAHQTYVAPPVAELFLSQTPERLAPEPPERAHGSSTATIRAARRLAAAPDVDGVTRVSLVVVRDGVGETFRLGAPARAAFSPEIANLLAGTTQGSTHGERQSVSDALSGAERRVLRYLPTNLTAQEIAHELYLSVNTVKTHMRHIYAKFDAHRRREAVERARALGLLPRSKHRVQNEKPRPNSQAGVSSGAARRASTLEGMR